MTIDKPFPFWRAAAAFAALWALLASPWLFGFVTIPWDAKAHWYPHIGFLARALHAGESPFWTPAIFSGSPEIADPQSAIFIAPFLALAALDPHPSPAAMDRTVFAVLLIGGLAVIALFRDRGWRWEGALAAAILLAFGGSAAWRIQHPSHVFSLALWPLAWLCLSRALDRRSPLYGALAGLVAAVIVLGRDQAALIVAYLLAAVVLTHCLAGGGVAARTRRALPALAAGALVGLAVVSLPIVLTALWGAQSNRIVIDAEAAGRGSLHPAHLMTYLVGNLYGAAGDLRFHWGPPSPTWEGTGLFLARNMAVLYAGLAPLALVLALARTGAALAPDIRFVTLAFVVVTLYALGWHTPFFPLFWLLPGADLYRRPADASFLMGGLFAILAGYAVHRLLTGTLATRWRIEAALVALGLAAAAVLIVVKGAPATAWAALAIAGVAAAASFAVLMNAHRLGRVFPPALIAIIAVDLAVTNGPSESTALPPETYAVLNPQGGDATVEALKRLIVRDGARRDRVELIGLGYHWQNAALAHDFEDLLGFNPVRSAAYASLTGAADIALVGARAFPPAFPSYRSPMADLLGLRFVVSGAPIEQIDPAGAGALRLVARIGEAHLYENLRALPRVFVVEEVRPSPPDLASAGLGEIDPRRVALVEGASPRALGQGGARILAYENTRVAVETETVAPSILILADAWHPWWRATVNGAPTPIRRAYGLVRSVEVPAGRARIEFSFHPFSGALDDLRRR